MSVLFIADWFIALLGLVLFVTIIVLTRYVSLGTICATLGIVVISFIPVFGHSIYFNLFALLMAVMVIFRHRKNIHRLLSGTENKLTF